MSRGGLLCRYFLAQVRAPIGIRYCCYGTTHSVGLDNTGKRTRSVQNRNAARSPYLPEEVQRQLHIWTIVRCIWNIGGDCNLLEWQESAGETRALRLTVEIHIWDPNGLYIWNPALYRFSRIHRVRAWRRTFRHVQLPRGWRSSTGSTVDSLEQFLASRCFYPFEVRTQEETGSTRRLLNLANVLGVAQPAALQISVSEAPRASAQEDATLLVE